MHEERAAERSGPPAEDAFWSVYDRALPAVYGYLARRTSVAEAEDLTQEVFLTAARTWQSHPAKVTVPWLVSVAKSRLVDHYRAAGRRHRNLVLAWSARPVDTMDGVESDVEARSLGPTVEAALDALPARQRAALVLRHLDDLSVAEVADLLGTTVRATESLLGRARRAFRASLQEDPR